jgi:hypothetical protein
MIFRPDRLISVLVVLVGLALQPVYPQGNGVIEGKLVNGTDPSLAPAKVGLDVVSLGGGMSVLKSAVTDSAGRFRIDGLPTDQPMMVRADYKSVNYHGQVTLDTAGKGTLEIKVFEPTTSMKGIRVEGVRMGFQLVGDRLQTLEAISFSNVTNPPRTFVGDDSTFRFSKAPGLVEPPRLDVTGPGSSMPLTQSPLESADGRSYYSLYPLRPGTTTFEVQQLLPYAEKKYAYRERFYYDVESCEIGVIPQDMVLSGQGLKQVQTDAQRNFAVYSGGPVKAGTEVAWTFTGGTPTAQAPAPTGSMPSGEPTGGGVKPAPTYVGQNALIIGSLLLMGFVVVLWYAHNQLLAVASGPNLRGQELKLRREQLLNYLADLDARYENNLLGRAEYMRERENGKRQLRRIALLLKK